MKEITDGFALLLGSAPYLIFRKLRKMLQNLSSAAVVIGALSVDIMQANTVLNFMLMSLVKLLAECIDQDLILSGFNLCFSKTCAAKSVGVILLTITNQVNSYKSCCIERRI